MARRKKRNRSAQRDHSSIANFVAARPIRSAWPLSVDLRRFHPDPVAAVFTSPKARIVHDDNVNVRRDASKRRKGYVPVFSFEPVNAVGVCVRRSTRREVLFALRRTGRGSRTRKRFNELSGVKCK